MSISMTYDCIHRPATPERVQELLDEITEDEAQLDSIIESYQRVGIPPDEDTEYQRIADRIRNNFSLAESLWSKIEARDDHKDEELKVWSDKQLNLSASWDWDE